MPILGLIFVVGVWAGVQNALAGGGSFVTLPTLILSGLDARAANIASTVALLPGQVVMGWVGRKGATGVGPLRLHALVLISLAGGAVGAMLLLITPSSFFAKLVPWLVLFATVLFAYGSFFRKPREQDGSSLPAWASAAIQAGIAVYGGYFGGGIGFLMLAALTAAGLAVRTAGATKNVLAAVMNASAVVVFLFTPHLAWGRIAALGAGCVLGGYAGANALRFLPQTLIRVVVVGLGLVLTVGLFVRG